MKVGDRVQTARHGHVGRVRDFYDDFWHCSFGFQNMTGRDWLEQQAIPFTDAELSELWACIACDDGGSVIAPYSDLTPLES